jgi:hypothetical protein
VLYEKE